ncbi:MAG TPA: hypothetical protein VFX02_05315 [Gammaproteobacteria bacterium]|nr:hypothetical protein [Gammaproteobacteria bacterium]
MNKKTFGILMLSLAGFASTASGLDYAQWKTYCSKEKNKDRCETAIRLCEQNDNADCDQIRTAFMLEQPIPSSVIPNSVTAD